MQEPFVRAETGWILFFFLIALIPEPMCPLLHEQSNQRGRRWKIYVSSKVNLNCLETEE